MPVNEERDPERVRRLAALPAGDREQLVRVIGEAALDLWSIGVAWPDLVERCLQAIEEDVALGRVEVQVA